MRYKWCWAALLVLGLLALWTACERSPRRPNIVLVVLDTVRRDLTGLGADTGRWQSVTPQLDSIAEEGTAFPRAYSTAPWTVPAHASIFTGRLPSDHGCTFVRPQLDPATPTLATQLSAAGYQTAAFFSNLWLSDRVSGLLSGFHEKYEAAAGGLAGETSPEGDQGGMNAVRELAAWLDRHDGKQPFFVFVNLLEAHMPYDPPYDYRRNHLAGLPLEDRVSIDWGHEFNAGLRSAAEVDWQRIEALYAGDVNFADRLLAALVAQLEERGLYEESVLIITSDHGENIGDHGLVEHQFSVHESLLAVPLVIRAPEALLDRGRRDEPVTLADLYATILDLAGVAADSATAYSRSLLTAADHSAQRRPLIAEYAGPGASLRGLMRELNPAADFDQLFQALRTVRVGDLRLTSSSSGQFWLHDLRRDPGQHFDISAEYPEAVQHLRTLLSAPVSAAGDQSAGELELDEETRQQLRALGYLK